MAFNSIAYLVFFLAVLVVSWSLVGLPRLRIWVVLLASLYFYGSNNHWLLLLLLATIQVDYVAAQLIEDTASVARRKLLLTISICTNLGVLGFFKYFNFFAANLASTAQLVGLHLSWVDLHIFLPIGISFYTFESMSYTIDVYQGKLTAVRSWYRYAFFVSYFPHLIAGPIVRPVDFLPQIDRRPLLKRSDLEIALLLIFRGLGKKIILADYLAPYANDAFAHAGSLSTWSAIFGVYCFAFQIYFDFSGYSDIAIGCSRLEGFWLPDNFRRPYIAASITEFWRRWHISLSSWLRDYLFIPLGGSRMRSRWGIYRNLMITMILGGLWHGAAWHFVLWGALQGVLLVVERHFGLAERAAATTGFRRFACVFLTFHLACFSWIFFRSENTRSLLAYLKAFGAYETPIVITQGMLAAMLICGIGWAMQGMGEEFELEAMWPRLPLVIKSATYAMIAMAIMVVGGSSAGFIYFQF